MTNTTNSAPCQIYLLTPPRIGDLDKFAHLLEQALSAAPVACLQIRLKETPEDEILVVSQKLIPVARRHGTAVLINDDAELALKTGADGVHLGQSDMNINSAKKLLTAGEIIGVTCHNSKDLAFEAGLAGADYVAFGAFFESETKPDASPADLELLTWWNEAIEIPSVAIGGINLENAQQVIKAGADFIALSSAVWTHKEGPGVAVSQLSALCTQYSPALP